jgi:hypothetical protein
MPNPMLSSALPGYSSLKTTLYKDRRKKFPFLPKCKTRTKSKAPVSL